MKRSERWIWIAVLCAAIGYAAREELAAPVHRGLDAVFAVPAEAAPDGEPPGGAESVPEAMALLAALDRIGAARQEVIDALMRLAQTEPTSAMPEAGKAGAR